MTVQCLSGEGGRDAILFLRFGRLFREPTLSLPPLGIFNTRSGALPAHPGLSAYAHTLLAGEPDLTCTLHVVDAGIESGPVIASRTLTFDRDRPILWHLPMLYKLGPRCAWRRLRTWRRAVGRPPGRKIQRGVAIARN
ncbi:formyltransferase family protein [Streptomyces sp. NPDC048644]|uniref:formyltransferase family protein n=1 Tax=Streptomyces sp. NPDC048644 TaxID=3365582 RepID=UPI00371417CD